MGFVKKKEVNIFYWISYLRCRGEGKKGFFEDFCDIFVEGIDKYLLSKGS